MLARKTVPLDRCILRWMAYNIPMATSSTLCPFPTYVQCATCIYWVPATELVNGDCEDCTLFADFGDAIVWEEV